ncbi:tetratricopeptide repeat protein [Aestuariivirga sp.]|uniref:tetratricopeptide repeat protein n=1 Tax=Aestuariivirga sp. TaxID=2650926 RepID=UPI003016DD69
MRLTTSVKTHMEADKLAAQSFFKGLQFLQEGRLAEAEQSFQHALKLAPGRPSVLTNLSIVHTRQGRLPEALAEVEAALRQDPSDPLFCLQAGVVLLAMARDGEALTVLDAAREKGASIAELHYHRANALKRLGRPEEALVSFERAIELRADYHDAHAGRASLLAEMDRPEEALQGFERVIASGAAKAETYNDHGRTLRSMGRPADALRSYDKAIALDPHLAEAYTNRGNAFGELQRFEEELRDHDKAVSLNPAFAEAHSNRGLVLIELGRLAEANDAFETAKALKPAFDSVIWNQANLLLLQGDLDRGFRQYEFRKSRLAGAGKRNCQRPQLSRQDDLSGKRLLIWPELFLGDMIQFCRYGLLAAASGAEVTIAAPKKLHRLLTSLGRGIQIADADIPDTGYDFQLPIMSGPLALQRRDDAFPAAGPYLRAEETRVDAWRRKIGVHGLKIGICWQGSKLSERDGRSFHAREFDVLSKMAGVRLISLQKFDGAEQLQELPPGMVVEELGDDFDAGPDAFIDAAAVIACMDLVITCDTSIAHLAGALGKPTWVLLKSIPEWRWFLNRDDSPWYPHTRLFRQRSRGEWGAVFTDVMTALETEYGL